MRLSQRFFLFSLICTLNVFAYKYLIISPVYGFSHMKFMANIADKLADAGHNVTVLQLFVVEYLKNGKDLIKNKNVEIINYYHDEEGKKNMPEAQLLAEAWTSKKFNSDVGMAIFVPIMLFPHFEHMCRKVFQDKQLHEEIKYRNFDVIMSETFDFCGLYLADYLKAKTIVSVFSSTRLNAAQGALGEPSFLNYLPHPAASSATDFGIVDRFWNIWHKTFSSIGFSRGFEKQYQQIYEITNGKINHWTTILNDVSYHFSNSNPYLDFAAPSIHRIVPIGGFTMTNKNSKLQLTKEFNDILNIRENTIFISFGSLVRSADMPDEYKQGMLELFNSLPNITFLWKYENKDDEFVKKQLPSNVYISDWFPQPALLKDKRVSLFITHGGLGSVMELAYSAKPAIVVPLFAEQPSNALMLNKHGSSETFSKYEIPNGKKLSNLISKIIQNDSYQKNANRLADILGNQPIDPNEVLIKYSENAAKFGRMPSLKPITMEMNIIQYYNIDLVFIGALILYGIYVVFKLLVFKSNGKAKKD